MFSVQTHNSSDCSVVINSLGRIENRIDMKLRIKRILECLDEWLQTPEEQLFAIELISDLNVTYSANYRYSDIMPLLYKLEKAGMIYREHYPEGIKLSSGRGGPAVYAWGITLEGQKELAKL